MQGLDKLGKCTIIVHSMQNTIKVQVIDGEMSNCSYITKWHTNAAKQKLHVTNNMPTTRFLYLLDLCQALIATILRLLPVWKRTFLNCRPAVQYLESMGRSLPGLQHGPHIN